MTGDARVSTDGKQVVWYIAVCVSMATDTGVGIHRAWMPACIGSHMAGGADHTSGRVQRSREHSGNAGADAVGVVATRARGSGGVCKRIRPR